MYKSMGEVLNFFDLDCICCGYDGKNVYGLPRSVRAYRTGYNFVEPAKLRRWSTGPRIVKYRNRGFGRIGCVGALWTTFSFRCTYETRSSTQLSSIG